MLVELLPNARGPLIVDACLRLGYTTITIAHPGLPRPRPAAARSRLGPDDRRGACRSASFAMHAMLVPALAVSSLVLGFNLLADGLREISLKD